MSAQTIDKYMLASHNVTYMCKSGDYYYFTKETKDKINWYRYLKDDLFNGEFERLFLINKTRPMADVYPLIEEVESE